MLILYTVKFLQTKDCCRFKRKFGFWVLSPLLPLHPFGSFLALLLDAGYFLLPFLERGTRSCCHRFLFLPFHLTRIRTQQIRRDLAILNICKIRRAIRYLVPASCSAKTDVLYENIHHHSSLLQLAEHQMLAGPALSRIVREAEL